MEEGEEAEEAGDDVAPEQDEEDRTRLRPRPPTLLPVEGARGTKPPPRSPPEEETRGFAGLLVA